MKSKSLLIVTTILLLAVFVPSVAFTVRSPVSELEISLAQESGQAWVDRIASVNPELPQWKGARVATPQIYHDLEGEVNAYMFGIHNDGEIVGHILVGSSQYNYDVIKAGGSAPPSIPSSHLVKFALEGLGIKVGERNIIEPVRLLLTGVDGFYALYQIDNQDIAVNLISEDAILVSDIEYGLKTPQEYKKAKELMRESQSRSTGLNWLPMSVWSAPGKNLCGPCSAVSIGAYYRDYKGYSNLPSNVNLYTYFKIYMYCSYYGGATMPWDYGPGFEKVTEIFGYDNFSHIDDWFVTGGDYWTVVSNIDNGWPMGLCITGQWHWRAIKGYYYDDSINWHYIYCTNSATGDSWEYLNWDALGWGLFTTTIKD